MKTDFVRIIGCGLACVALALASSAETVVSWQGGRLADWAVRSQVRAVRVSESGLSYEVTGGDPQIGCTNCSFVSRTSQYFRFKVRAKQGGRAEIFWRSDDEPSLQQRLSAEYQWIGDGQWHEYEVRPYWPNGKRIVQLRFDAPDTMSTGTRVEVAEIAVVNSSGGAGPVEAAKFPGVMFSLTTNESRFVTLAWTTDAEKEVCRHQIRTVGDGRPHTYWFDLTRGYNWGPAYWYAKRWKGNVGWFDVMDMRHGKSVPVADLRFVAEKPDLPPDVVIDSVTPGDGINRVGQDFPLEFVVRNLGTRSARQVKVRFDALPGCLANAGWSGFFPEVPPSTGYDSPGGKLANQIVETIPFKAVRVGKGIVTGTIAAAGMKPVPFRCPVEVLPSLNLPRADYVPEPKPVKTTCRIGAIAFPGWTGHRWECVRNFTPERKPILGWYDEASPVTVDWQIKHLAENGISYLLVDWFPRKRNVTGDFVVNHDGWIRAFQRARWRKYLKWAIFWESNMTGHDPAFVRQAIKYAIDNYFSTPEYLTEDGLPVVALYDVNRFDRELPGGSRWFTDTFRQMAKAAGYKGVRILANRYRPYRYETEELESYRAKGFDATLIYHYRGDGVPGVSAPIAGRRPFDEVARTNPEHWRRLRAASSLPFLASISTGWDDRPWYGDTGLEVYGRTVGKFAEICRAARAFADETGQRDFLLGPLDEWGEGSYAAPCAEFGFGMYEAVRNAFGVKPAEGWPVNVTPKDVGLSAPQRLPADNVGDVMTPLPLKDVKLGGKVGEKMMRFLDHRIVNPKTRAPIYDEARRTFERRDDDQEGYAGRWRGEFWGKQMLCTARVADYLDSAEIRDFMRAECGRLMKLQEPGGYLGSYRNPDFVVVPEKDRAECLRNFGWLCNWNLWNRKYTIWGMFEAYRVLGDRAILDSVCRQMDNFIDTTHRLGLPLRETGVLSMGGLPPMSVLKPLILLYRETGRQKYLDYAREMLPDWDRDDGARPNLIRNATRKEPLWTWYPRPDHWAKSYEMMSCLQGLLEYYRLTGETRIFEAVKALRDNLASSETNPIYGVGFCDKFYGAAKRVNAISEVCDLVHWIRLNYELYLLTGDVKYVDAMELTYYNAFLAGILRDGSYGAFAVRGAQRHDVQRHKIGCSHNQCCVNNAARTFMDMAAATVTRNVDRTLFVNFYQDATVEADGVKFEISGNYPVGDLVTVRTTTPVRRLVRFRIPGYGLKPTTWRNETIPAGVSTRQIRIEMKPVLHERTTSPDPDEQPYDVKESWFNSRYATTGRPTPESMDIWKGFRTVPAATVTRGPLVLAKAKRLGTPHEAIFPATTVNGRGYALALEPLERDGVLGAWKVKLSKPGKPSIVVEACDYQSAGDEDLPTGADAFSIWF